jgi:Holliday junction DNA helicase RuvA
MIGHLRGKLFDKRPNQVVVDVSGVGYEVLIPLSTFYALGELHQDVNLLIHTHVREDQLALYGFVTSREKQLFELLLSASGVGPVLALKILSGMSVEELLPAIRAGDLARLTTIPGVGRKTAERIVVELRDRADELAAALADRPGPERPEGAAREALSALQNLGYGRAEAERVLTEVQAELGADAGVEAFVRGALRRLAR